MTLVRRSIEAMEDSPILEVWRMGVDLQGVIGLWAGEPDVPTPQFICDAAAKALAEGRTFYTHNRGIPQLRLAIADYLESLYGKRIADDRIAATSAGMNAVQLVCQALLDPGDKAVVVTPSWPNVGRAMQISGARLEEVPLRAGVNGWSLDLEALFTACRHGVKLIYLASPANPTGWMISIEEARALLDFARANGAAILADEVYHRIVYDRRVAFSFLDIADENDPVFVVNSFSKSWAMTGWRLGWLVCPVGYTTTFEKLIQFNTSGGQEFLQFGAIEALKKGEAFVSEFVERCRQGRETIDAAIRSMPRVSAVPSNGSFYAMFEIDGVVDTLAFCKRAVTDARVGLAPGVAFGAGSEHMVRLCYAKKPETLTEAMNRLDRFIRAL